MHVALHNAEDIYGIWWKPEMYINIHLDQVSFFRRLKQAIKYVFGVKCGFGDFTEHIVDSKNVDKLISLLEEFKKETEKFIEKHPNDLQ